MTSPFSEYVRSLGPDGEPPDVKSFDRLLETLRRALVYEMKRRALWSAPPSYLGIYGGASWSHGDLLEELVLDCYAFTFIRRLPGLKKQLLVRSNVDGLVFLNIRNFLHEAQKRHDPMGFRIFEVLHAAVRRLIENGVLHVLDGEPRVRNETVLGFSSYGLSPSSDTEGDEPEMDLRPLIERWTDGLMPELVTAWNREEILDRLEGYLLRLPESDVEVFRFRDLVEPMKDEVRSRWHGLRLAEEGETAIEAPAGRDLAAIVRLVRPDRRFEERQTFANLVDCTAGRLDHFGGSRKTKEYLLRLWLFLRNWAAEPEDEGDQADSPATVDDSVPSDKKLGEMLGIPRGRIPELKETLGGMVEACREAETARARSSAKEGRRTMGNTTSRRHDLRLQTGNAAARWAEQRGLAQARGDQPRPGETFVSPATRAFPVEWAVLEGNEQLLVVAVDEHPLVGSRDVDASDGRCLRCGHGAWVAARVFDTELRTGALEQSALERALRKRAAIDAGTLEASSAEQEVDVDPEYLGWVETLDEARAALPANVLRFERRAPPRAARVGPAYALAAVFAVLAVGLSLWSARLQRQVDQLSRPVVVGSSVIREIRFQDGRRSQTLEISQTESHVTIYLVLAGVESFPSYRLEILDEDGELSWSQDLERDTLDEYVLTLDRRFFRGRSLELRLSGLEGGRMRILDTREIRIEVR